ncbi:MAG: hypothetical protein FJ272_04775 [Planctomycetes bacterium]|nr:hypothetical protein [Planctomycetota bacterium]
MPRRDGECGQSEARHRLRRHPAVHAALEVPEVCLAHFNGDSSMAAQWTQARGMHNPKKLAEGVNPSARSYLKRRLDAALTCC